MTPFLSNKNENIIANLNNRICAIENIYNHISDITDSEKVLEFYKEVSYYVHYIQSESTLAQIFSDLINLNNKILTSPDYLIKIKNAKNICYDISIDLVQNFKTNAYITQVGQFANPFAEFDLSNLTYNLIDFPNIFSNLNKIPLNLNIIEKSLNLFCVIHHNIQKFTNQFSSSISMKLIELDEIYKFLKYQIVFVNDYVGTNAAIDLLKLYKAINPVLSYGISDDDRNVEFYINSGQGEAIHPLNNIWKNCLKVKNYLCSQISLNLLKNVSIERFKAFVELYRISEFSNYDKESQFQHELEQFLFLQGFFPLSEIQFKNIRIDILALQTDNIVLYETKLIKEKTDINPKAKGAKFQANRYHGVLNTLPNLVPEVHIILFTLIPCEIINDFSFIQNDNITFYFHLVHLYDKNTSQVGNYSKIDINNFL